MTPGRRVAIAPTAPLVRGSRRGAFARGVLVCALGIGLASGCHRGWNGDVFRKGRFSEREASYRFGLPGPGWQPIEGLDEVQVAWVREDLGAVIDIHGQCDEHGDSSLQQYTDHLRIDWTDWEVLEQEDFELVGRVAVRTVAEGRLDGVERRNEFVVVKKNGCIFDLRYSARPETFAEGRGDFQAVVAGFEFPLRGG